MHREGVKGRLGVSEKKQQWEKKGSIITDR
jgi:hypothetical protein